MILNVNEQTLRQIQNPALRAYAGIYVNIYRDFLKQVAETGIELDLTDYTDEVDERIGVLQQKGALVRNDRKSIYINNISPACVACQTGRESATFFISLQCHRDCFYCFNPNQEDYDYYRTFTRDVIAELERAKSEGYRFKHLALTGGEPLLHAEQALAFFHHAGELFPSVYRRLYTSGDHITKELLQELRKVGLEEIRFSVRMHDLEKGHRHTFERIAWAKEYIPYVMVEMPVLPGTLEQMKEVLRELDQLEIFSINLLEFCYPMHNAQAFSEKGYKVKGRPYRVLYNYWYAGGLPVARSELVCLDLLDFALDAKLKLGVHYCSVENKHTGQVYQQNTSTPIPKIAYFSPRDYFLKTAKVFGEHVEPVRQFFENKGYKAYSINDSYGYLEFHVSKIRSLLRFDTEVGISYNILEQREGTPYLRELKLDVTTPQSFQLSEI